MTPQPNEWQQASQTPFSRIFVKIILCVFILLIKFSMFFILVECIALFEIN
jgi:hypothetical protein